MSEILAATSPEIVVRTFEATITEDGDGRTVEGVCVPYNVKARVADPPDYTPYDEMWMTGAFRGATKAPNRVLLDFEHRLGISDVLGHGVEFEERDDGLHGQFRVSEGADGDKALGLIRSGVLAGLSVFAKPLRSMRAQDGTMQRVKAHLDRVALCRSPAYEGAQVLAVRTEVQVESPPEMPDELTQRLERLGVVPLQRVSVVAKPWDGEPSRFSDEEYAASCLLDRGDDAPARERCSVPVLEPNGDLNRNALAPAAAALVGTRGVLSHIGRDEKSAAARKLIRYYRLAAMDPPPSLVSLARS